MPFEWPGYAPSYWIKKYGRVWLFQFTCGSFELGRSGQFRPLHPSFRYSEHLSQVPSAQRHPSDGKFKYPVGDLKRTEA